MTSGCSTEVRSDTAVTGYQPQNSARFMAKDRHWQDCSSGKDWTLTAEPRSSSSKGGRHRPGHHLLQLNASLALLGTQDPWESATCAAMSDAASRDLAYALPAGQTV